MRSSWVVWLAVSFVAAGCSAATGEGLSACNGPGDCPASFPFCHSDMRCWSQAESTDGAMPDAGHVDGGPGMHDAASVDTGHPPIDANGSDAGGCTAPETSCGGVCVNTTNDAMHCGTCATVCPGGASCVDSACTSSGCGGAGQPCCAGAGASCTAPLTCSSATNTCGTCGGGNTACGSVCTDTNSDSNHCGNCATTCGGGMICTAGLCTAGGCPASQMMCGGLCRDTTHDPNNCGSCGNTCASGMCAGSTCVACPGAQMACSGSCFDTTNDINHCGSCTNVCPTAPSGGTEQCVASVCTAMCSGGDMLCGGSCTNTNNDSANCGSCGMTCVGASCMGGHCMCGGGQSYCGTGSSGMCTSTSSDPNNCGMCGHACGGTQACVGGSCMACGGVGGPCCSGGVCGGGAMCTGATCACPASDMNCGGVCTDTTSSPAHCGSCGNVCMPPSMANATCTGGMCGFMCTGSLTACGGACVDTSTSMANCGGCGQPCTGPTGGSASCSGGICTPSCPGATMLCGSACLDTSSDPSNCGSCGMSCPATTGEIATCTGGACGFNCSSGYHLCGSGASATCANDASTQSCGTSSCTPCTSPPSNGHATCTTGACGITCNAGFHLCGTTCPSATDPLHCGAGCTMCTVPANGTATCSVAGVCGVMCNTAFTAVGSTCQPLPPRPIAPLSVENVTTLTPTLRWVLPTGVTGAHVDVCADRACLSPLWSMDVAGTSVAVGTALPIGPVYWRLFGRAGAPIVTGTVSSPTWEFVVPGAQHTARSTSWGNVLDFDGNGYADVLVQAGSSIGNVFYGGPGGVPSTPSYAYTGYNWFAGADVTGDGYTDLVAFDVTIVTHTGGASGLAVPSTSVPSPRNYNNPRSAGDVNGDGYADMIVDANNDRVSVLFGSAAGLVPASEIQIADPYVAGAQLDGFASWGTATSIAGIGDVNGDGFADIALGAERYPGDGSNTGVVYVYYGSPTGPLTSPYATINAPGGGSRGFGGMVAGAGDVNGDGYADLVVGGDGAPLSGGAWVYLGGASGIATTLPITLVLEGAANWNSFGFQSSPAGDVNADGYSDLVVVNGEAATGVSGSIGLVYFYFGGPSGVPTTPSTTLVPPPNTSIFGNLVAGVGSTTGVGFGDIVISSSNNGIFIAYGSLSGPGPALSPVMGGAANWISHL